MSIRPSPLLGYNNNVRHKGKVFHIQTEDSGARYGHIMTHLFTDGGRILKSVKTSYAEYVGNERMTEIVREMMKQQHKAMFIALRDGKFDAVADITVEAPPPAVSAPAPAATPRSAPVVSTSAAPPPPARARSVPVASSAARLPKLDRPSSSASVGSPEPPGVDRGAREPEELSLDIDALERAAAVDSAIPAQRRSSDLPPPPDKLLRERTAPPAPAVPGSAAQAARRGGSTPVGAPAGDRRYAPTRPASIFGQARPQHGKTIFGEDLMSDKSLDEVILSYLADDLDDEDGK
ncbi:MAG TPA: hypothetical protein VE987_09715 [Polyangiaceae bacterium]|nr:hypothetical protein [Polyangiaceae bacterium]